ncbi:unnamed protein product [Echinostoma caproni]|uniref:PEHE domain-containing protein n=1 Tax=Echinostoma caproni TaxID=27848 RepID=A0A183A7K2_9TREM|nr:unnamed protein product [Echinostoma caproni]
MGCGLTKPAVSLPSTSTTDSDNHHSPIDENVKPIAEVTELQPSVDETREPERVRSITPKSAASGEKSSGASDSEANEEQDYPIRITTKADTDSPTNQNVIATESKKGFVAFDIPLDGSQATILDNVLKKPLPKRLRHLEPLGHAPQITTEMLMEKLEKAEEKRQKALARWKEQAARRREMAQRRNEQFGDHHTAHISGLVMNCSYEIVWHIFLPFVSYYSRDIQVEDSISESKDIDQCMSPEDKRSAGSQLAEILQMTGDMDNTILTSINAEPSNQYNNNMTVQRAECTTDFDSIRLGQAEVDINRAYLFDFPTYRRGRSQLQVLPEEQEYNISDEETYTTDNKERMSEASPKLCQAKPSSDFNQYMSQPSKDLASTHPTRLNRSGGI